MREENFWCKKPRYSEVRVIARRVIARYDYQKTLSLGWENLGPGTLPKISAHDNTSVLITFLEIELHPVSRDKKKIRSGGVHPWKSEAPTWS